MRIPPTRDFVMSILDYNHITGILIWKSRENDVRFNTQYAGKEAGHKHKRDRCYYRTISFGGKAYFGHNLAYLIAHNEWHQPIDHKDGDGLNNAIDNLLKSNRTNNSINRKLGVSKSGYIGVIKYAGTKLWWAIITIDKKRISLGTFVDKQDAINARKKAEKKYGFDKIIFAREI